MTDFIELLRANPYPGRGIAVGSGWAYYFIMGRSANSRNRVFERTADGIRTRAFDEDKMTDPSLIIYHPVRRGPFGLIVANGDQSDTIRDMGSFHDALMTREYEPDAPHWTPRISALLRDNGSFELSILKRQDGSGRCLREFFSYPGSGGDEGFFISTYRSDGDPLPPFGGEPIAVTRPEPEAVWEALDPENKVALYAFVRGEERIFNRYG